MQVDVVIPTVDRDRLLVEAIQSGLRQKVPFGGVEIIVVDNSPDGSQRQIVEGLASDAAANVRLRCIHEPRPGLAFARNRGVLESNGDFIVFLDDDEVAARDDWLAKLVCALVQTEADVAFGPVVPQFENPPARFKDFATSLYSRQVHRPDGATITDLAALLGTGNSCFRRATCFDGGDEPFRHAFDKTGGEDIDLLYRLRRRGKRFVWAADAPVAEFVPGARLERRYLSDRRFRQGQQRAYLQISAAPRRYDALLFWMAAGVAQAAYHASAGLIAGLLGRSESAERHRIQYWGGVGKVLWQARHRRESYGTQG
ncbi:MAG: glycosyltransferase [Rhizomicrobium sp.]